jgi:hypothetical protein
MKTTLGNEVKVLWLRPITEEEAITLKLHGRIQSLWGVEVNGVRRSETFTSKRAAMAWVRSNYNV